MSVDNDGFASGKSEVQQCPELRSEPSDELVIVPPHADREKSTPKRKGVSATKYPRTIADAAGGEDGDCKGDALGQHVGQLFNAVFFPFIWGVSWKTGHYFAIG
jgi:hypothetical protein